MTFSCLSGAGPTLPTLTGRLAEKAWDRFRMIEAEGGLLAALRTGTLQRAVAAMRERRLHRVVTRALPITGITTFPEVAASAQHTQAPAAPTVAEPLLTTSPVDFQDCALGKCAATSIWIR